MSKTALLHIGTPPYLPDERPGLAQHQECGESPRIYRRRREQFREFLFGELGPASHAVLPAELAGGNFSALHASLLREDLESLGFRDFHVVLYVRDPADYFLSAMQQILKLLFRPA